ncbi:hypothetical protein SOVF_048870 [Spinacia oleracea]|uniref:Uncharacterized protein n=1 Tax=Spinacia oleracea TaxID=3562 RepID=A0ABM3R254_SPIOL|nr:uncharacterized protein LOC130464252 [Spinacia oleracea]KNA20794.1 hypothetical protein SOVF_048870 [Spinacia oleracea]
MKEAGNLLFKQGDIEDALEKYGYAGIILGCFQFEENDDRAEFFDLANCILLNSAACFSRKREFEQVGKICSVILEFNPNNVKASYRRAMAAIELGRSDLAYPDLLMASHNDPRNTEVRKKLEEVKQSREKEVSGKHSLGDVPIGLGLGLSPPRKKSKGELVKEHTIDQVQLHEKEHIMSEKIGCDVRLGLNSTVSEPVLSIMKDKHLSESSSVVEENLMSAVLEGAEEMMEDVLSVSNSENSKPVEPNYRVVNRLRSGSSLSISKKDYQLLLKGKTIQYFNSKVASPMTIRVIGGGLDNTMKRNYECHEKRLEDSFRVDMPQHSSIVSGLNEELENQREERLRLDGHYNLFDSNKESESESMSVTTENYHHIGDASEYRDDACFKSTASIQQDEKFDPGVKVRKKDGRCIGRKATRKQVDKKENAIVTHSYPVFSSIKVEKKRKVVTPPSDCIQRPRKKVLYASLTNSIESYASSFESCASSVESCISSDKSCNNKVICVSHEMANSQE